MTINPYTILLAGVGCWIVVWTKDRRTIFRMENGDYSPILRPYVCNTIIVWIWLGMMMINPYTIPLAGVGGLIVVFIIITWKWFGMMIIYSDTVPKDWVGWLIVVGTKDRRTIFRMENGGYSPILRPYACNTIITWMWLVMMKINPYTIPLAGVGCLIVVFTIIPWRWLVMMTINSDIIRLAGVGGLIVVGTKDRRTIFRMENDGYSPILRPYVCNTIIAWMKYGMMMINTDAIPLAGVGCLIVVFTIIA